jgi:hypothetical protein
MAVTGGRLISPAATPSDGHRGQHKGPVAGSPWAHIARVMQQLSGCAPAMSPVVLEYCHGHVGHDRRR